MCKSGAMKANDLPEPVSARIIALFFAKRRGTAYICTGVGL